MRTLYDSTQPLLNAEFPTPRRVVGVRVTEPYPHAGMKRVVVDVDYEVPILNTKSLVRLGVDPEAWRPVAAEQTGYILARLDEVIAELQRHRDRLAAEHDRLTEQPADAAPDAQMALAVD